MRPPKKKRANVSAAVMAAAALLSVSGPLSLEAGRAPEESVMVAAEAQPKVSMRTYQLPVFTDHTTKVLVVEQSRQTGKSTCAANWAVDRIHLKLASGERTWKIIVLSNSKVNGAEFARRAADAARAFSEAHGELAVEIGEDIADEATLGKIKYEDMRFEIRVTIGGKVGRIMVLAANPRTARGVDGDLILDEFAFHEDAAAIWEAAEPIISSRPEFICRIMSTHNGESSLFNRWIKTGEYPVYSVKRSEAWGMGQGRASAWRAVLSQWLELNPERCLQWLQSEDGRLCLPGMVWRKDVSEVADNLMRLVDGQIHAPKRDLIRIVSLKQKGNPEITPEQAEAESGDKRAYRQNYENDPNDMAGALLPWELIQPAEQELFSIDDQAWSEATLDRLAACTGDLYAGQDVGRAKDLSVVIVMEKTGDRRRMVALLRMADVSLPAQRAQMIRLLTRCGHNVRGVGIDATGLGLGLAEELQEQYGGMILPVNFSSTVPVTPEIEATGRKAQTMRVTEYMALNLYRVFDDRLITIVNLEHNSWLRDCLRKPGRVVSKSGVVSIASERTRTESGHLDHADAFWALALAEHAGRHGGSGGFREEDFEDGAVVTGTTTAFGGGGRVDFSAGMGGPVSEKPGTGAGRAEPGISGPKNRGLQNRAICAQKGRFGCADTLEGAPARPRVFNWGSKPFNSGGPRGGFGALTETGVSGRLRGGCQGRGEITLLNAA